MEGGLAKAGVETISIWSDPKDDCSLFMCLAAFLGPKVVGDVQFFVLKPQMMTNWWWFHNMFIIFVV